MWPIMILLVFTDLMWFLLPWLWARSSEWFHPNKQNMAKVTDSMSFLRFGYKKTWHVLGALSHSWAPLHVVSCAMKKQCPMGLQCWELPYSEAMTRLLSEPSDRARKWILPQLSLQLRLQSRLSAWLQLNATLWARGTQVGHIQIPHTQKLWGKKCLMFTVFSY